MLWDCGFAFDVSRGGLEIFGIIGDGVTADTCDNDVLPAVSNEFGRCMCFDASERAGDGMLVCLWARISGGWRGFSGCRALIRWHWCFVIMFFR